MKHRKEKIKRVQLLIYSFLFFLISVYIALITFKDKATLYITPTDIIDGKAEGKGVIRLGGLVEKGSLHFMDDNQTVIFRISDMNNSIIVKYKGIITNLFVEGSGTVATGTFEKDGTFLATELLAKHDEKYMPPEVAKTLEIR